MKQYWLTSLVLPVVLMGACSGTPDTPTPSGNEAGTEDTAATTPAASADQTAEALAGYDIPETATVNFGKPDVGAITVGYPSGWTFFNDFFITSSEDVDAIDLMTGMPAGSTFVQINGDRMGAFNSEDIASYAKGAYTALADNQKITFSEPEAVPIAGEGIASVAKQIASKPDIYDTAFYIMQTTSGEYVTLMFYTAPGELDSQTAAMEAMVASASYTAP